MSESAPPSRLSATFPTYAAKLTEAIASIHSEALDLLAADLQAAWQTGHQVFICGNGGSAANALHLANDFLYGVGISGKSGLRVHALPANTAITTCLGNDVGYDRIFADQLRVLANAGDVLIVLSGSGNSPNILLALEQAKALGVRSHAIVGFDGGEARVRADNAIHVSVHDMQIAEDTQMLVGHALMQLLRDDTIDDAT